MLDDATCRLIKLLDQIPRRFEIHDVVIRKFLPLKLTRSGQAKGAASARSVERGLLVRILSIAKVGNLFKIQEEVCRERAR